MAMTIAQLQALARKAALARDKFEIALEKAKQLPLWEDMCEKAGICPDSDTSDWMC